MSRRRLAATLEAFCREYIVDLNGTDAWKRSHPKCQSNLNARVSASKALTNPNVQRRLAELQRRRIRASEVTADGVLAELAAVAFSQVDDVVVASDGTLSVRAGGRPDALQAVSQVERTFEVGRDGKVKATNVKVRLWSKPQALEMLGRHLALFREAAPLPPNPYDFSGFADRELEACLALLQRARRPAAGTGA